MTHTLPQTALAYPTCKTLRDAGYPQKNTVLVWVTTKEPDGLEPFCEPTKFAFYNNGDPRKVVAACPNSDELLAAIQERWPGINVAGTFIQQPERGHAEGVELWANWPQAASTIPMHDAFFAKGDALNVALAALYIALAGGQPCS